MFRVTHLFIAFSVFSQLSYASLLDLIAEDFQIASGEDINVDELLEDASLSSEQTQQAPQTLIDIDALLGELDLDTPPQSPSIVSATVSAPAALPTPPTQEKSPLIAQFAPSESSASKARHYFEEGEAFFAQGKYQDAFASYRNSLYEDPSNVTLNYKMGQAAMQLGDAEEAVFAFERALTLSPNFAIARLEKARAHMALGSRILAKDELQRVLEQPGVPDEVKANVQTLLASITAKQKHEITGVFLATHTWDSNATLGTGPVVIPGLSTPTDPSYRSDRIFATALVVSDKYPLAYDGLSWSGSATGYISDNNTINSSDLKLLSGSSTLVYKYKGVHTYEGGLTWSGIHLDESMYQSNPGTTAKYVYDNGKGFSGSGAWAFQKRHHFGSGTGSDSTFGLANAFDFSTSYTYRNFNTFTLKYSNKYDKTPSTSALPIAYYRNEGVTSYKRAITPALDATIEGTFRHDNYQYRHGTYTDRRRRDLYSSGKLSFTYKHTPNVPGVVLALYELAATATKNNSNIATSDYYQSTVAVSTTVIF